MVTLAQSTAGLIYQSDGTLTGWTTATSWSTAADPAFVAAPPLPLALLGPAGNGAGSECDGVREGQLYVESGTWYLLYDAGDHVNGWRECLATSLDRGLTLIRLGSTAEGYALAGGGSIYACANGWMEKRGSTYYRHRVTASVSFPPPDTGLPSGAYGWDYWSASAIGGPWTGVGVVPTTAGAFTDAQVVPGSVVLDGTTYVAYVQGAHPSSNFGYYTATSPGGPFSIGSLIADPSTTGYGGRWPENPKGFYHPGLARWCILVNLIAVAGGFTDRNAVGLSSSSTTWTSATWRQTQGLGPIDTTGGAIGVACHVTGPDGALIYDATTGIVPITYDADPVRYGPGWHQGRSIRTAALEPSASCIRYAGSANTTARTLSRSLACTNFVIEFGCEPTAFNAAGGTLVIDLVDASTNGYRFTYTSNGHASISKLVGGTATVLSAGSGVQAFDATHFIHRVKVGLVAGSLSASLDGESQATASDSTYTSFATLKLTGKGIACDVRRLSVRSTDVVTVAGLAPGTSCLVRGYGGFLAGSAVANGSGVGTFSHVHYPLWGLDLNGVDYTPATGIWGGDTLTFS